MANCTNCGAPLNSKTTICRYCQTVNDVDLRRPIIIAPSEHQENRICPRCSCTLLTIDISGSGTFHIERCEQCFGIFFDSGELEGFLNTARVSDSATTDYHRITALVNENFHRDYPVTYIKCPVCQQCMNRVNYGRKSGVIINKCTTHGVWLDSGVLHHIVNWIKAGGPELEREHKTRQLEQDAEYQIWKTKQKTEFMKPANDTDGQSIIAIAKTILKLLR
jgi:Zn-finger nucleic acid-binding protein